MARRDGRARPRVGPAIAIAAAVLGLAACGGGNSQDKNEPTGTYKLDVISASFPGKQRLGEQTNLKIVVKNVDTREIPMVAVTIDGFNQRRDDPTLADPSRPIWVINSGPPNTESALANTWALGPVPSGQSRTFTWNVTAVQAGTYSVRYRVAGGLTGKAKAELPDGSVPKGSFIAQVSRHPRPVKAAVESQTEVGP